MRRPGQRVHAPPEGDADFRGTHVAMIVKSVAFGNGSVDRRGIKYGMEYLPIDDSTNHSGGSAHL